MSDADALAFKSEVTQLSNEVSSLSLAGLKDLSKHEAMQNPDKFNNFILRQTSLYKTWRREAEKGFEYIPKRYRLPVQAAAESFDQTIREIEKQPLIVYEEKIRSSRRKIIWSMIKQLI